MMENANDAMTELMTRTRASKENAITTPGQMRHARPETPTHETRETVDTASN